MDTPSFRRYANRRADSLLDSEPPADAREVNYREAIDILAEAMYRHQTSSEHRKPLYVVDGGPRSESIDCNH